ncbi:HAD family hydrolase [Streptomyces sp.]|uniref:HAD family hydrolase n=1 Tax=Streptomyces sp. TaxID=1931 RepID=UPI002D526401|nr:HAD family hydrolase [Streptomyces sp.]HZF90476.1 HAD family hydrolase [Streptomyces sp.]
MTSDTTRTEPVVSPTDRLRELVTRAEVVLWDFDGPICRLFAGHPAPGVAGGLVDWLEGRGLRALLTEAERHTTDPQAVLRAVDRARLGRGVVAELEERLTQEELRATATAMPTAWADPLIRTWTAVGARLAVASGNSPRVIGAYLAGRGLAECFGPHIYGRDPDPHRLEPGPHHLDRALDALTAAPETALFIGDTPTDHEAARRAGIPFLGYARNDRKARLLRDAGAGDVVDSLEPVLRVLRARGLPALGTGRHRDAAAPRARD